MKQTTSKRLQERRDAPLVPNNSAEPLNATTRKGSKPFIHGGSGCNAGGNSCARMSRHSVFVLDKNGKPLTPTTPAMARKLMKAGVAEPRWNKFGLFGIQMVENVREETPKTALGVDPGTKFEGYSVVVGNENNLNVMWKLPDKKQIIIKIKERNILRRNRRNRKCRRREKRSNNRNRLGFIAPSQLTIVQSRLKSLSEFFKCYPVSDVAIEDISFNHKKNKWGNDFSTMECGKTKIYKYINENAKLRLYKGYETKHIRTQYSYMKCTVKSAEKFESHCADSLSIALNVFNREKIDIGRFIVIDDTYRPVRRKLYDTQFSKSGVRQPYSKGNFKSIRKGEMCAFGQICGGEDNQLRFRDWNDNRIKRVMWKVLWLSHRFKIKQM